MRLYRVERITGEIGPPVEMDVARQQILERLRKVESGERFTVVPIDFELNPADPPTPVTRPMFKVWRETILRYPTIGSAGTYVCKPASQHRFGNAWDATAPRGLPDADLIEYLWDVFEWLRRMGIREENGDPGLPVSELIFRDKITTRAKQWSVRPYEGAFHYSHVHVSAYPLILPYDRPCGVP